MNELRLTFNIYDILEDYNQKVEEIPSMLAEVSAKVDALKLKCTTMGAHGDSFSFKLNNEKELLRILLKSSWRYAYQAMRIKDIAPKSHLKHFEDLLENPPEFTEGQLKSVFKEYYMDPRGMQLKAFAEIFCSLDKFYKSHSNIKVGVKGLPKRIIMSGCGDYGSWGWNRVADVVNCLMRYRGEYEKCVGPYQIRDIIKDGYEYVKAHKETESYKYDEIEYLKKSNDSYEGLSFKTFQNGNCHIIFDKKAMDDTNKALAEYYGDVLPDAYEHTDKPSESKEVSKDLQFYRTPSEAVEWVMGEVNFSGDNISILEPSCGDGTLMDGIRTEVGGNDYQGKKKHSQVSLTGVEFDAVRAEISRAKGYHTITANFLTWEPHKRFDYVVMNPPFYGKHYMKHIDHAFSLLKDGGTLYAILPITAKINHGLISKKYDGVRWRELPMGSFKESGTNINTVLVTIFK